MKKILTSAFTLLSLAVLAQKPYIVQGNIKGLKTGSKVYLTYWFNGKPVVDSANVSEGKFQFKGSVLSPVKSSLNLNKNYAVLKPVAGEKPDFLSLYLEPGTLKVSAADSLSKATITGSVLNDDDKKLNVLTLPIINKIKALNNQYILLSADEKTAQQQSFSSRYMTLSNELKSTQLQFAKNNINSFISLVALSQLVSDPLLFSDVKATYHAMGESLKGTTTGADLASAIVRVEKTSVGAMAIDFTQNDVNDKPVKLSDFKGTYVLLDFWASWCGPCRAENPNVVKAFNDFKDKNFTVLGISLDRPGKKDAWLAAIEKDGLTWTQVSDLKFWGNEVAKQYNITGIPANFLIDPSGKIVGKNLRGEELHKKLAELL